MYTNKHTNTQYCVEFMLLYTFLYTPIAPDDYNAVSGLLLTFSPDQLSQTFPVAALDDDALEDVEQFFAVASSDVDRVTIDPDQASISIIDTDGMYQYTGVGGRDRRLGKLLPQNDQLSPPPPKAEISR